MLLLKNILKSKLAEKGITLTELARQLNTQPQNLSNKLSRGSLSYDEVQNIADILGYSIKWIEKSNANY